MSNDLLPRLWGGPEAPPLRDLLHGPKAARRAWVKYWLRDSLQGGLDMALHHAMKLGTADSCSAFGAWLGRTSVPRNHPHWHRDAHTVLARLRPDMDEAAREVFLRDRWANLGRTWLEFSVLRRLAHPKHLSITGADHLLAARGEGRPVILAAFHLGNWELIGLATRHLNVPTPAIYQPPASRFRHWLAVRARLRAGFDLQPPGRSGALPAARLLRQGRALFLGIDEYVGGRVHAPFLGRPVEARGNIANAVRLARMTGAAVLPTWVERQAGTRFVVHFEPAVDLGDLGTGPEAVLEGIARLNGAVEPIILAHLDQWLMLHHFRFDR